MLKNQTLESQNLSPLFRGEIAQLKVQENAARKGITCSIPTTEVRYDILLDIDGKLLRTQIKNCNHLHDKNSKGELTSLRLNLYRMGKYKGGGGRKPYTKEDIDLLLVYVPIVDTVLCFGPEKFDNKKRIYINLIDKNSDYYWEKFIW